jgi:hemolysin activation/secretion protein
VQIARSRITLRVIHFLACLPLGISTVSVAADANDHLNAQEAPRPRFLPIAPSNGFELPPISPSPASPSLATPSESIRIGRITFRGNTAIATGDLEKIAAPYVNRSVSAAELEYLRQQLTRAYVDRGFVNSGILSEERVGDQVIFRVVEGQLTGIQITGEQRLNTDYIRRRLTKATDGPFNVEVVRERFQLLLVDPLFERLNARLVPGVEPGEAYLNVDVIRARPYQATIFLNNYRPPSIGSNALGVSGWVRNLTGQGDTLEMSFQGTPAEQFSARSSLTWRMPINYVGTQVSVALDHGRSSVVQEPLQILDIRSTLDSKAIGLSQTVTESLRQKFSLGVDLIDRQNRTLLLGQPFSFTAGEPNGVTHEHLVRTWQEYSYRTERQVLVLRSTFTAGRNNLEDVPGLPPANSLARKFHLWLGQVQYAQQVSDQGAQVVVRATVQQTADKLLALDGMSIGGAFTVRGYLENQLIRDKGMIYNIEFEQPVVRQSPSGFTYTVIPFYDYGRGHNNADVATTISSLGFANRLRWRGLSLDIAIAKKLQHPSSLQNTGGALQSKGIHAQLAYTY